MSRDRDETVYVDDALAIGETGAAILVLVEGEQVWIPKSQIHSDSEVTEEGDKGVLAIPYWIAEDRGLT